MRRKHEPAQYTITLEDEFWVAESNEWEFLTVRAETPEEALLTLLEDIEAVRQDMLLEQQELDDEDFVD